LDATGYVALEQANVLMWINRLADIDRRSSGRLRYSVLTPVTPWKTRSRRLRSGGVLTSTSAMSLPALLT
jgi:hypothetical protein